MNAQTRQVQTNNIFKNNPHTNNKTSQEIDYSSAGPDMEANRVTSLETTQKMYNEYSDIFTRIECFKGTFLQVNDDAKLYQAFPRYIAHAMQEPFKKRWKD